MHYWHACICVMPTNSKKLTFRTNSKFCKVLLIYLLLSKSGDEYIFENVDPLIAFYFSWQRHFMEAAIKSYIFKPLQKGSKNKDCGILTIIPTVKKKC